MSWNGGFFYRFLLIWKKGERGFMGLDLLIRFDFNLILPFSCDDLVWR